MDEQGFSHHVYVRAVTGASCAYGHLGRWHEAEEEGQKALKIAEESSDNSLVCRAAWNLSMT